jgi:hypothetical protein
MNICIFLSSLLILIQLSLTITNQSIILTISPLNKKLKIQTESLSNASSTASTNLLPNITQASSTTVESSTQQPITLNEV